MSFAYHNGQTASIVVSKDEKKIRLQTASLHEQWLVVREMFERLEQSFRGQELYDVIEFEQAVPTQELFQVIDDHFELRKEEGRLRKQLDSRTV